jgi:hypothetical protein
MGHPHNKKRKNVLDNVVFPPAMALLNNEQQAGNTSSKNTNSVTIVQSDAHSLTGSNIQNHSRFTNIFFMVYSWQNVDAK